MTTKGRGEEAALPPVQRPPILASSDGVGTRPRVSLQHTGKALY